MTQCRVNCNEKTEWILKFCESTVKDIYTNLTSEFNKHLVISRSYYACIKFCQQNHCDFSTLNQNRIKNIIAQEILDDLHDKGKILRLLDLYNYLELKKHWGVRHSQLSSHIDRALVYLEHMKPITELNITSEIISDAKVLLKKYSYEFGHTYHHMVASSLIVASRKHGNTFPYYKITNFIPISSSQIYARMKKINIDEYTKEKEELPFSKCSSIELYDAVNMLNTLEQEMLLNDSSIKMRYFEMELRNRFQLLEKYVHSKEFIECLNDVRKEKGLSPITLMDITRRKKRFFIKKMVDIHKKGMQMSAEKFRDLLRVTDTQMKIEDRIKRTKKDDFDRTFTIYCDVDHLINASLTEIITVSKFKDVALKCIVLGSGDKDFVNVLQRVNKDISIVIVTMSGSSLSHDLKELADVVISVYPKVMCIKPRNY